MTEQDTGKNPLDAHREGLEQLERAPHHQTTEHDKAPHAGEPQPSEPPGEAHRGGPLPNQKR
jgi:hypothetical protein